MSNVLDNLSDILTFVLNVFTKIMTWSLDNPILAISIYIPLAFFLIGLVFKLVTSFFSHKNDD